MYVAKSQRYLNSMKSCDHKLVKKLKEPMEGSSMDLAPAGQVMSDQPEAAKASGDLLGDTLLQHQTIYVQQKHSLLEMCSGGCCEKENVYTIHSESVQGPVLLTAKEKSGGCARICCDPRHSLVVKISHPSTGEDTFDYSLERPGLCSAKPMMCCGCAWTQGCSDEMILHKGDVGTEQPGEIKSGQKMARVRQATCFEAFFNPTLFIIPEGSETHNLKVKGPCIFGGCSELCVTSHFKVTNNSEQEVGEIMKLRPKNIQEAFSECATDVDRFQIDFKPELTGADRAALLTATFLADYMLFERDLGMLFNNYESCGCTCFQCYCCGCVQSCVCAVSKNNNSGEGGGGGE
eukprot:g50837.t1